MTFRRTACGLANLYLFVGVDLIVFTEGGPRTVSKQRAMEGDFNSTAIDIAFWRELFTRVRPQLGVEFRALGSKNVLQDIAREIITNDIGHVCVAMDRDYDGLCSNTIVSPKVIYTRGYSWENELYNANIIERVFYDISRVDRTVVRVRTEIQQIMRRANANLRWLTYADFLLCIGGTSLFSRKGVEGAISDGARLPCIRRSWLFRELQRKRRELGRFRVAQNPIKLDPKRDCYGKVLLTLSCRILFYLIKKYTKMPSLPKDYAIVFLLKAFGDWFAAHTSSNIGRYYCCRLAKIAV